MSWKELRLWSQRGGIKIPALPHTIWALTGKSDNFFQPLFYNLSNGNNNTLLGCYEADGFLSACT